jgi:5-dehydro-4-deoxyglucarate dehydratase
LSISTIAPKLALALADAGLKRDFATLDRLMRKYVHPLYALRDRKKGYEVAVMKRAMELLGKPAGPVRPPLAPITVEEEAELRGVLDIFSDMVGSAEQALASA